MLPVTHGVQFTRLHVLLYTIVLVAVTLLPFASGMSGLFYLGGALRARRGFPRYAWQITAITAISSRARPSVIRSSICRCCSPRC